MGGQGSHPVIDLTHVGRGECCDASADGGYAVAPHAHGFQGTGCSRSALSLAFARIARDGTAHIPTPLASCAQVTLCLVPWRVALALPQ